MIYHDPPPVPRHQRRNILFENRGEDIIRIDYLKFESDIYPRSWDTIGDDILLTAAETGDHGHVYLLPICGTGRVFIRWKQNGEARADSYEVLFDKAGNPYPYYFGGDKWTMALRHAALRAVDEYGND